MSRNGEVLDRSGSCAVITFIVDDICYIANVGDSRAIMSKNRGKEIVELTNDHKPNNPNEKRRIIESGGKVYQ
jgi:serine/threonine protein phosphatase PrpC